MKTGIELIADERQEQITKHRMTIGHDMVFNNDFQLIHVANGLLFCGEEISPMSMIIQMGGTVNWNGQFLEKLADKPYKERLIIAGALIAAEIDRIQNQD